MIDQIITLIKNPKKAILILTIITLLVWLPLLRNGFVWDDEEQIVNNTVIRQLNNIPALFTASTFNTGGTPTLSGLYYKPIMPVTFAINYALFGLHAWGYHLGQLLLHLLVVLLIYKLTNSLFRFEFPQEASVMAFFVSLTFAIHPANCEAVVYLSSLQEILYTLFGLLAFKLILVFQKDKSLFKLLIIAITLLLFSLLSKESGLVFLAIITLWLYLFDRILIPLWSIFSLISLVIYSLLRFGIAQVPISHQTIAPIANTPLGNRLLTIPFEIFSYLRIFIFPKNLFIAQHQLITSINDPRFYLTFPVVIIFLIFLFILWRKTKSRLLLFFETWFLVSISITLNIFPLDMTIAERWLYTPIIGLLGTMAILIHQINRQKPKAGPFFKIFLVIIIICFSMRTFARTLNWQSGSTLFSHDVHLNPEAFDLQNNLGVELFRRGQTEKARPCFEKSIQLAPNWWTPYNNLGAYWEQKKDYQKALDYYQKSIQAGDYYLAYENYANLLIKLGRVSTAKEFIDRALKKFPLNQRLRYLANSITKKEINHE